MSRALPTGTVTFLLTDIEGSTAMWERQPGAMRLALARHDSLVAGAVAAHGGEVVKSRGEGDSVFAVFARATDAVAAALRLQRDLAAEAWPASVALRVRAAVHTGEADMRDGDYFGPTVNRAARLRAAAHGGQTLLSQTAYDLVRDDLPAAAAVTDLGEHRLKDLIRPERVFQLDDADRPARFPPLAALDRRPHNLPILRTPLVGRGRATAEVSALLARDDVGLLTLTGPGGTGKTRLALQVAAEVIERFADGVAFVALAPVSDPGLVPATIAAALGVPEAPGRPILASIAEHLRARDTLLVLDNFEQVLDAAPSVAELLDGCPRLKVLVTSRALLHLYGEREYPVPPLALPPSGGTDASADSLSQYAAVSLFIQRALDVKPDFAVTNETAPIVAEICQRLDGLPLAIELAAARSRLLPPASLLARLDHRLNLLTGGARNLPARQQTLRGTIAWSHDLLSPEEGTLFRRLGVFVGGATLDAIERVAGVDGGDPLDLVASLADKSLLRQDADAGGEPRFTMLETIREFALEQLAGGGEESVVRRAHAAHVADLAERADAGNRGPEQSAWRRRLGAEIGNVRAALGWSLSPAGDIQVGLRIAGAVWWYWWLQGCFCEGRDWFERLLAAAGPGGGPPARTAARATALALLEHPTWYHGNGSVERTLSRLAESESIAREIGDERRLAHALHYRGHVLVDLGRRAEARALYEEAIALCRATGDDWHLAFVLMSLGFAAVGGGDHETAGRCFDECLPLARRSGDRVTLGLLLHNRGMLAHRRGDDAAAEAGLLEALAVRRELGHPSGVANTLNDLGEIARHRGDFDAAERYYLESRDLRRELGDGSGLAWSAHNLAHLALARGDLDAATAGFRESLAERAANGHQPGVAACLAGLGAAAVAGGDAGPGARLLAAAESVRRSAGAAFDPANRAVYERAVDAAHLALGPEPFSAAWSSGSALSAEAATALAMGIN